MFKKSLSIIVLLCVACLMFAGCADKDTSSSGSSSERGSSSESESSSQIVASPEREELTKEFLKVLLTSPNEKLVKAEEQMFKDFDEAIKNSKDDKDEDTSVVTLDNNDNVLVKAIVEEYEKFLTESCVNLNSINGTINIFNINSDKIGATTTVDADKIKLTQDSKDENIYAYELTVEFKGSDGKVEELPASGSVQFDGDKIKFFRVNTKKLVEKLIPLNR